MRIKLRRCGGRGRALSLLVLWLAAALPGRAADVSTFGDWVQNITTSNLISGAGSGLQIPESASGITSVSISALVAWRLYARRSSGTWNNNLTIWIKRTSNGSGLGTISGGTSYIPLTNTDTEISSGLLARGNVGMQFKVTGLTPAVGPGNYQAPIVFTVVAL